MEGAVDSAEAAVAHVRALAAGESIGGSMRVTMHFHPDAPYRGLSTLSAIARRGAYLSQFETNTGNGGLTAFEGGDRWRWESRMFGGVYDSRPASDRPKYGSLDRHCDGYGGSPRFGSSYFVLAEHTLERTTFCFPDSVHEPQLFGTAETSSHLLQAAAVAEFDDPLDHYIEAHVHGPINIECDVEALVLDPSYRGTRFEDIARTVPCAVVWHDGYRLAIEQAEAHPEYRGNAVVQVARSVARHGWITPYSLGPARVGNVDPQDLKKVWHYVARYGRRASAW